MATVTSIATALKTQLTTLSYVDQSSITQFLPAIETQKVALIIPPYGQRDAGTYLTMTKMEMIHRIRCEFWVRLIPDSDGSAGTVFGYAREIPVDAMQVLMNNDGTNYDLAEDELIESETVDTPIDVEGSGTFAVVIVTVPCRNEVDIS